MADQNRCEISDVPVALQVAPNDIQFGKSKVLKTYNEELKMTFNLF